MALSPLPIRVRQNLRRSREGRIVILPPMTTPKSPEVAYRGRLNRFISVMTASVKEQLIPLLKSLESEYTADAYARTLEEAFSRLRTMYEGVDREARTLSEHFVESVDQSNRQRFYKGVEEAVGINLSELTKRENLTDVLGASVAENVSLIRSIPQEYFKRIESIVFSGTIEGSNASSMIEEIMKVGHSTHTRAKIIARDQTSKINSALNSQRQESLGVEEYIWRTSGDDRVRQSHRDNNGKIFRWDTPPSDTGHPGHDPLCRCVAQAILRL